MTNQFRVAAIPLSAIRNLPSACQRHFSPRISHFALQDAGARQPTGYPAGTLTNSFAGVAGGGFQSPSRCTRVVRPGSITTGTSTRR